MYVSDRLTGAEMRLCGSTVGDETCRNILLICLMSTWRRFHNDIRRVFFFPLLEAFHQFHVLSMITNGYL